MKTLKLSFDLSDEPEIVELLKVEALRRKTSQKGLLINALKAYFSDVADSDLILKMAEKSFSEWSSESDKAYDDL